jgi:hypothetical protein
MSMASTTRSGTKYSRSVAGQQQKTPSDDVISLKLDLKNESAATVPRIQHDGQAPAHDISLTHLAHSTGDHVDFELVICEEIFQTGADQANDFAENVFHYSAEFSGSVEKQKIIQGHSKEGLTTLNIQERISLTPEQICRIQQSRSMAIERLAKRNAEKMSPDTQVQVTHGMIKNQNKSSTCAYSEIVTPDKEFRMMINASQGDIRSTPATVNLPIGHEQITLTPTQSIRIERNRLDALKRLRTK